MLITEFAYNNIKNASTCHIPFKLNCKYHSQVLFKEIVDPRSRSYYTYKLAEELRELMEIYYQNLFYAQKLQKKTYGKRVKSYSYALGNKVWLNSKYIKTK